MCVTTGFSNLLVVVVVVCVCLRSCHPCVTCVFVTNVPTMRCVCVYVYALKIVCLVVCGSALAGSVL